jgi:MYXO-CTERM domain-containing protein
MRRLRASLTSVVCAAALCGPTITLAQPTEVAFLDGDGHWQWVEVTEVSAFGLKAAASSDDRAGPFNIIYEDVERATGVGFDDPDFGEARRATLWAVLDYIGQIIDVPGEADLLIRASQTDGGGALASAGPLLVPESGFQGGFVFEHLTTGVDPSPNAVDGTVTVDFGFPWNSETDRVADDEQDLFTTLLHEVTHSLGFLSVVASDGRSAVFNTGDRGLFSVFDSLLIRESTEMSVFLEGGEVNATSDDFVASGDLVFAGERTRRELGFYPRVFAPRPFFEGSSIGHWSAVNGPSVMLPGLSRGTERREYEPWEVQALADLGYEVFAPEPPPLLEPEPKPEGEPEPTPPNSDPDSDPQPDPDPAADPDPESEPEADPDPGSEFVPSADEDADGSEPTGAVPPGTGSGCEVQAGAGERTATWTLLLLAMLPWRRRRAREAVHP